jgi:hypothetical protein
MLLHEFYGDKIPEYAILSHRWEDSEVTFQDLGEKKGPGMLGWDKVKGCCAQAILGGLEYVVSISCSLYYTCDCSVCLLHKELEGPEQKTDWTRSGPCKEGLEVLGELSEDAESLRPSNAPNTT